MKKIIFYNFIIFFILIFLIELIFGYWLKKENFGHLMRDNRNQIHDYQIKFNDKIYVHRYKRNFYGFRGDEIEPSNIKIVFLGGSTGNQRFTPEPYTIVGRLNSLLTKDNINHKIYNASTDGKSTFGMMNDFQYWFSKIENFDPKLFIFYIGLNDKFYRGNCKLDNNKHFDYNDCMMSTNLKDQIIDYLKNNSIIYLLGKKLKHNFFPENKIRYDFFGYKNKNKLYENFSYLNFIEAQKIYKKKKFSKEDIFIADELKKRLGKLVEYASVYNASVMFITQVQHDGVRDYDLYKSNMVVKEFSEQNNLPLIPLDERMEMQIGDFYDPWHTTLEGSNRIANEIYPKIKEIIELQLN